MSMSPCSAKRVRALASDGSSYNVVLKCTDEEPHTKHHYDETFLQSWHDDEEEQETAIPSHWILAF
jgi:hypothetical protein